MASPAIEQLDRLLVQADQITQTLDIVATQLTMIRVRIAQVAERLLDVEHQRSLLHRRIVAQELGYAIRQCAWCGVDLGLLWMGLSDSASVTHGICFSCAKRVFGDVFSSTDYQ